LFDISIKLNGGQWMFKMVGYVLDVEVLMIVLMR